MDKKVMYTSVVISVEAIKQRLKKSLNLDYIADVGCLLRLLSTQEKKIAQITDAYLQFVEMKQRLEFQVEEKEKKIKELEEIISDGVLKDHSGCQVYHDEEYTKLESKFYEAAARIKGLKTEIKRLNNVVEGYNNLNGELSLARRELEEGIDFDPSAMAREIFQNFLKEKDTHSKDSIVHYISKQGQHHTGIWIYQITCAVHQRLQKLIKEQKEDSDEM